jgi:uncharacterized membrane protein YczE
MTAAFAAGAAAIATSNVGLVVICWRRRTVLGAILGAAGIALVAFAIASGLTSPAGRDALAIALVALLVGTALYGLGRAFDRLLGETPEEKA